MSAESWAIVASALGFAGSLMLVYPAWRIGRTMRQVSRLRALSGPAPTATATRAVQQDNGLIEGREVARIVAGLMETHVADWRPFEHGMLVAGTVLIALSFGVDLWVQLAC